MRLVTKYFVIVVKELVFYGQQLEDCAILLLEHQAYFDSCFSNKYIFEFTCPIGRYVIQRAILNDPLKKSIYYELLSNNSRRPELHDMPGIGLCDFIKRHTNKGDTIEIYIEFGGQNNFNFGPPNKIIELSLLEFAMYRRPNVAEKTKIIINI